MAFMNNLRIRLVCSERLFLLFCKTGDEILCPVWQMHDNLIVNELGNKTDSLQI